LVLSCKRCVLTVMSRFSGVYFVDGTTLETVQGSFEDIARYTSAGETTENSLRWFSQQQTEWLLLIDNADDPKINLRQFLPACTHGNIIITSRNRACRQHAPDSNCNVVEMEQDEAIELLLKSSMVERSTGNRGLCASICKELGYLALAVAQAVHISPNRVHSRTTLNCSTKIVVNFSKRYPTKRRTITSRRCTRRGR
jgi:hypothetical protein